MNCFFSDEVSSALDFLKEKKISEKINETEISVTGDDFGLGRYVSLIENSRCKNSAKEKVIVSVVDFTKSSTIDAKSFFKEADEFGQYIFLLLFDFEKPVPSSATALSERELTALSGYDSSFKSIKNMTAFENSLKSYSEKFNIKVIRYTNVYGPEIKSSGLIGGVFAEFKEHNRITLSKADYRNFISVSYISSVLKDIYSVVAFGKIGNVYNGNNTCVAVADIKNSIYKSFSHKNAELVFDNEENPELGCSAISCRKIEGISGEYDINLDDSLFKLLLNDEDDYIKSYVKKSYDGKIQKIREKEISLLSEVDRICKKHNINYYLVGGSLLGAVRNGGFIPWDDDVDICMLREDFEKFRKICPEELGEEFAYQSYRDEKSTHYIYDKIRLKGTYFSSEHSNKYDDMENGIFLDVFVFDKTANSKLLQKFHVFLIVMLRRLINIRWTKEPVSGKFAFISSLILPLVCIIPFGFYHALLEKILRFFEKSKRSRFLLDGTGLYIKKGAFPMEWATENKTVKFENTDFPGVKDSNGYLKRWYGENYMSPPEISKRTSGHKISRLDLGEYLFNDSFDGKISLKGELYDE